MTEFTPTTGMIRRDYCFSNQRPDICGKDFAVEFDRWHAEEIRKAKAEGWDEGRMQGVSDRDAAAQEDSYWVVPVTDNPYRKEQND